MEGEVRHFMHRLRSQLLLFRTAANKHPIRAEPAGNATSQCADIDGHWRRRSAAESSWARSFRKRRFPAPQAISWPGNVAIIETSDPGGRAVISMVIRPFQ